MSAADQLPPFDPSSSIATSMAALVGSTPMVMVSERLNPTTTPIALKLESMNPTRSVKDRLALGIIERYEADGVLVPGESILVEATSGNTGIAVAQLGAIRGYRVIITMPESMSQERRCLLSIFGAQVVLTPAALGMRGAIAEASAIVASTPGAVLVDQFNHPGNVQIHYEHTGPEIWRQTNGKVRTFIAGVGTGGTLIGVGRFLKEQDPTIQIVAVEPSEAAVLSGGSVGSHKLQGMGAGFVPSIYDPAVVDRVITVSSEEAIAQARILAAVDGVFGGFTTGACFKAALTVAKEQHAQASAPTGTGHERAKGAGEGEGVSDHQPSSGGLIVAIAGSCGERYLSTALFEQAVRDCLSMPVTSAASLRMY